MIVERTIEVAGRPARLLEVPPRHPSARGSRADGYPERPPVVLIHGIQALSDLWRPNLEALAAGGRHVVAPDLPVHGGTAIPASRDLTIGGCVRFLEALLDRLGFARVDLVGHSFGGLLAARLALDRPDRVRRLVLVSAAGLGRRVPLRTALSFVRTAVRWVLVGPGRGVTPRHVLRRLCYDPDAVDLSLLAVVRGSWDDPVRRRALTRLAMRLLAREGDLTRELGRLAVPTLFIWGAHDRLTPLALGQRAAARIPGSRLVVFEACGHLPNLECPALFDRTVSAFLDAGAVEAAEAGGRRLSALDVQRADGYPASGEERRGEVQGDSPGWTG